MNLSFSFFNLWLFVVIGYAIIWAYMPIINKKRGKPIEDPELYNHASKRRMYLSWYVSLLGLIASSLFIPVQNGSIFVIGGLLYLIGLVLNIVALSTFSDLPEKVNTKGIYRVSRNPMYVGGFLFLLGLCVMGWTFSVPYGVFAAFFFLWIYMTHQTVKKEEAFLLHKYGDEYKKFKQKIPRYIGFPKNIKSTG